MIAIISACGANFSSVVFACERLGKEAMLTVDPQRIKKASHVILPGVGTANQSMQQLQQVGLPSVIRSLTQPVLGICLGMQILYEHSSEGDVDCLDIIPGKVRALVKKPGMSLPHMGWNVLHIQNSSGLLAGIEENSYVYYVHGYASKVSEFTLASSDYTETFSAAVQYQNFYGLQFHPERSGPVGAKILKNFLDFS